MQKIFDSSVDLISITDLQGRFQFVSKSHDVLGYDAEDLIGKNAIDYVHPDDLVSLNDIFGRIVNFQEQQTADYRYRMSNGEYLWFETTGTMLTRDDGTPEQILFNTRDITERKEAEQLLDRQRQLLRTIIDSIPQPIYVKDVEGRKQIANKTDYHYSGFEREEDLIGKSDSDIWSPEIATPFVADDQRVLMHGESVIDREEQLITRNGHVIWQLTTKLPLYESDGTISGLVGIGRDITERKQAEEEIQHQLAEKETLLREVHHRIKNNMGQIESLLSFQADSAEGAEVKSALNTAMSRVRSTRILYEKLLVGKGHEEVSMKDYLESLIELLVEIYNLISRRNYTYTGGETPK
ncbi:MAG: PAS domain S-box protein, partial [Alkalispirochaeta sp.]